MTDRSLQAELLGLLGRFVLFLALLALTVPTGLSLLLRLAAPRLTSGDPAGDRARDRSIEIISPLDALTGPPTLVTAPNELPKPDDSWVRPGERLAVAPNAPEGSWPMVEGADGRLYQLTPGGRHPVSSTDVPARLPGDGLELRLFKLDATGKPVPDGRTRFVP